MRPQDIVVLHYIITKRGLVEPLWSVAAAVHLSVSEVGASLARSTASGLYDEISRHVNRGALLDFLTYGLRYVFPALPGGPARGVPTAFSAPVLREHLLTSPDAAVVWPDPDGQVRGTAIEPLYPKAVAAALANPALYDLLALTDALRLGRRREQDLARRELAIRFEQTL